MQVHPLQSVNFSACINVTAVVSILVIGHTHLRAVWPMYNSKVNALIYAPWHTSRGLHQAACMRIAGVILKKGRSMYEIPAAKSKLAPLADEQSSQSPSDHGTQQPCSSQILTASVANPATPSYSETF